MCNLNCGGGICLKDLGMCIGGCKVGFYGLMCNINCSI